MLVGKFQHSIDAKGRIFIPAKYRADLGTRFFVNRGQDGCIRAYNEDEWEKVMAKISASTAKSNLLRRKLCASTSEVEMDAQGRLLLPEELRVHAQITDSAYVVGMGDWVEFWNPDVFNQMMEEAFREEDIELMDELGIC